MNNLTSLQRKLLYLGGIILLLIPITWLGLPPEPKSKTTEGSAGGKLAQKRSEYGLGESDLGNVDPASSTMNLLLLGFRGIATSLLWMDAQDQQRNKDWAALRATTESIILLQPHFLKVWHFQGWNLAYNVSAEWDAVADRFYWVKEGIKFYKKGRDRNEKYPEMYWYVGDTNGRKVGRSDEWKQFRKFYRADPDTARFKGLPDPDVNPRGVDNYDEARVWFLQANKTIDDYKNKQHIMGEYLFRAYPGHALFDYAAALQREGIFDEVGRNKWYEGYIYWTTKYGAEEQVCELGDLKMTVHLEHSDEDYQKMAAEDEKIPLTRDRPSFWINLYQNTGNYRYWRMRSKTESEKDMSDAHRDIYEGEQALYAADTGRARKLLVEGMEKFEKVLDANPELKDEADIVDDALLAQYMWRECLKLDEVDVPEEFPLKGIWDKNPNRIEYTKTDFDRRRKAQR